MPKPIIHYNKVKNPKVLDEVMDVCPVGVFAKEKGKVIVKHPEKCIGCRACEGVAENGEVVVID
jgi:NAD-dependent dihydropyrimidine dehydrogenase PreA subunit